MIHIHLYGELTDIVGKEKIEMSSFQSLRKCLDALKEEFPSLNTKVYRVALNNEIIDEDVELKQGDIIALMPPFAGG